MQDKSQGEIPDPKNSSAQRSRCCGLSRVGAGGSRLIISLPKFSLEDKAAGICLSNSSCDSRLSTTKGVLGRRVGLQR